MEKELNTSQMEQDRTDSDLLGIAGWFLAGSIFAVIFSFSMLTGAWIYHYLLSSPIFTLTEVKISGSSHLSFEEVLRIAKLQRGESLLAIDLEKICKNLQGHPWVAEVSAEKDLPDTLRIIIQERKPVAAVEIGTDYYFLDERGVLFLRIKEKETKGIPILTGLKKEDVDKNDPVINRLMWDAVTIGPLLKERGLSDFTRLRINRASGLTLISPERGISATIGAKDFGTRLDRLRTILGLSSDPRLAQLISIDLSYANQAIIRLQKEKEPKTQWGKG